jgi:hypothetical protein
MPLRRCCALRCNRKRGAGARADVVTRLPRITVGAQARVEAFACTIRHPKQPVVSNS